jgi:hypothetical protein
LAVWGEPAKETAVGAVAVMVTPAVGLTALVLSLLVLTLKVVLA